MVALVDDAVQDSIINVGNLSVSWDCSYKPDNLNMPERFQGDHRNIEDGDLASETEEAPGICDVRE